MRDELRPFFNATNTVFLALLVAFALTVSVSLLMPAESFGRCSVEPRTNLIVSNKQIRSAARHGNLRSADQFIEASEAKPGVLYDRAGRVFGYSAERWELTGISTILLLGVIPWFLIMLSLWPLFAAVRARRWFVCLGYICAMVFACWRAWEQTWQHFPTDLEKVSTFCGDPVGVWFVFLLLALAPRRALRRDGTAATNDGRIAASMVLGVALLLIVPFALANPSFEYVRLDFRAVREYRLVGPEDSAREFAITDVDLSTVPKNLDWSSGVTEDAWTFASGSGDGRPAKRTRGVELGPTLLSAFVVFVLVVAVSMWPYRVLMRKRRDVFARDLMTLSFLAGYAILWVQRAEPLEVGINLGLSTVPWIMALIVAYGAGPDDPEGSPELDYRVRRSR